MTVRTLKTETGTSYFCTITNKNWLPLFSKTDFYNGIYKWFDFLKRRDDHIIGYVIMNNHLHVILYLQKGSPLIKDVIGEAKRLMSYAIVNRLKKLNEIELLKQLQNAVTDYEYKKGIRQKVFEDSFDGKECFTYDFIQQKLNYMHNNPVKAELVECSEKFTHSSAKFYLTGEQGIYPVTHYLEIYEGKEFYEYSKQFWFK